MSDTESKNLFSFLVYSREPIFCGLMEIFVLLWEIYPGFDGDSFFPRSSYFLGSSINHFWHYDSSCPFNVLGLFHGVPHMPHGTFLCKISPWWPQRSHTPTKRLICSHHSTSVVFLSHLSHLITAHRKLLVPRTCTLQSTEQVELHDYLQTAVLGIILDLSFHKHQFSSMTISSQHICTVANKRETRNW